MTDEYYVEVYLTILCNIREGHILNGSQIIEEFKRIQNSIKRIEGIKHAYLILKYEVADITAFAEWRESEIDNKLDEIRKIPGIKSVESKRLVPA
jgi:hypothetical protein